MKKLAVSFALIAGLMSSVTFANVMIGRTDIIVNCQSNPLYGYGVTVFEQEGFNVVRATIAKKQAPFGALPVETLEVKRVAVRGKVNALAYVDAQTGGKDFALQVQTTPQGNVGKLTTNLPTGKINVVMDCQFPARPM